MKHEQKHNPPEKYGMVIDLDKCTGCGACMVACMSENNVPFKEDESDKLVSITWMRFTSLPTANLFRIRIFAISPALPALRRQHGGHSPCVSVCPATATDYSQRDGHRQPDLYPLFRMPLLHGGLPLPCHGISTGGIRSGRTAWSST
jgi:Fe-S-cluster-containing dehydrogenase component